MQLFAQAPVITTHPYNQGVIEGETATFIVIASGDSLTYQWYKDGSLIGGATDSVYTTPATVLGDNGSEFFVEVANGFGSDTSDAAKLYVTAVGSRVTSNEIAAYDFKEGSGNIVHDVSGVGTAVDLTINNINNVAWSNNGLAVVSPTLIQSAVNPAKILDSCLATNELTIEVWIAPKDTIQNGNIVTYQAYGEARRFSLFQYSERYATKVRILPSTNLAGEPFIQSTPGWVNLELNQIVYTRSSNGQVKMYRDGEEITSINLPGDFGAWEGGADKVFGIACNFTQGNWLGAFYYTGIYNRALSGSEISHNFSLGIGATASPFISSQPKDVFSAQYRSATFTVIAYNPTPDSLSYQWQKNGINIPGETSSEYIKNNLTLADDNSTYRVIVSNSSGSDTSNTVTLRVTPFGQRVSFNLQALYDFRETSGTIVHDVSAVGSPLDLTILTPSQTEWTGYTLKTIDAGVPFINTVSAATKLYSAFTSSNELTLEAWIKPKDIEDTTFGKIITISQDADNVNFSLVQNGFRYEGILRTSDTDNSGVSVITSTDVAKYSLTHVIFTRDSDGIVKIFIDGEEAASGSINGDFSNWDSSYLMAFANELVGGLPWPGHFNLVAFFNRALSFQEVRHNFLYGARVPFVAAPTQLTAQANQPAQVLLKWKDNSSSEEGFVIERQVQGASTFEVIDTTAVNDSSYSDINVTDTTTYTYRVKAKGWLSSSTYSNEASATTLLFTISTPTSLTANLSPTIVNHAQLTWQDNSSNELGFIIERKTGDSASVAPFAVLDTLAADLASFIDSTLADTTTYTFRVKAFNEFIESDYSNVASVTTILSTVEAPTSLTASLSPTIVNRTQLTWQDNSTNELGFIVERKTGDSASVEPFSVLDTLTADVTSFEDSTLADTTTYTFRVKAFNAFIGSDYSNFAWVTTILSTVVAPGNLTAIVNPADTNNVLLSWVDNSPNELGFIIERKTGDSSSVDPYLAIDSVAADVISYEDTTVADTTTYTYRVQGFNEFAVSEYSNQAEVTTPVPVELTSFIASVTDKYVQLDWETATELNNAGFSIQRSKDNNKFIDIAFVKGKGTTTTQSLYSYADKSVLSGKYYYRLKQVDFNGSVTYSKSTEVDLGIPKDYALEQNYPNPFNPSTTIRFALPINARVIIKLYNALGQEVATLLNTDLDAGIHETVFNASNLSSGVYFYMLKVQGANSSNFTSTKRMILMK